MTAWHSKRKIDEYLAGELAGEEALRAHLRKCGACRDYYDEGVQARRAARGGLTEPGLGEMSRLVRRAAAVAVPRPAPRKSEAPREVPAH